MLKNWTFWEIKELFAFAYSSKIWPQELRKVTNFIVSKTLKLYDQKILPKDLSLPMVIKLWTFFEFKSSMWYAFKNKTRGPTHLNRIGCICICLKEILLNWLFLVLFHFNCVDFRNILLSKYLALNNLTSKTFCMQIYCNFSYKDL